MKKQVITLPIIATLLFVLAVAAAADTPAERLSKKLLGAVYPITNGYQPNRVHAGVDFGKTTRTAIDGASLVAPVSGKVVANNDACGKVAIFDGTNTVILAHMKNRTSLGIGKQVSAGTYIGQVSMVLGGGCSANAPHLHVEIRTGNHPSMADPGSDNRSSTVNPLSYLIASSSFAPDQHPDRAQRQFVEDHTKLAFAAYYPPPPIIFGQMNTPCVVSVRRRQTLVIRDQNGKRLRTSAPNGTKVTAINFADGDPSGGAAEIAVTRAGRQVVLGWVRQADLKCRPN